MNSELMERLNDYIDDPMWADHAEVSQVFLSNLRAELSRLSALVAWQDIETAPRRVGLLLWNKSNGVCHGALWSKSHNEAQIAGSPRVMRPTHWMPLPGAPVSQLKDTTNADK